MSHSPINRIPPEILKFTFSFLLDEEPNYNKVLRCVWKSLIPSGKFIPDDFLEYSAFNGMEGFCRLAKNWGATDFNWMLQHATGGGHENLCILAKDWGATKFNRMLWAAARNGNKNLCRLAKDWGATWFMDMLANAANDTIHNLANEWIRESQVPTH